MLCSRSPSLAAVEKVGGRVGWGECRCALEFKRVEAGVGLGDGEACCWHIVPKRSRSRSFRRDLPVSLPSISGGRNRRFCSSVPYLTTGARPKIFIWMLDVAEKPPPDSEMVCIMVTASASPRAEPPYSAGMHMPSQPSLAIVDVNSLGQRLLTSQSSQYSSGNLMQILEMASRTERWDSVRSGKSGRYSAALAFKHLLA